MPERRRHHCTLRNSPFHPTVPKRAGIHRTITCPWAKLGGNAAPKTLMETAPPNLKLGFDCPRQVFSQGLVGWRRWRGQKIDSVLDTLKLHASFNYTEASMKWKRRVPREGIDIGTLSENPHLYEIKFFSVDNL
jgi:hypothetical protein